jgi:hypothetical protein
MPNTPSTGRPGYRALDVDRIVSTLERLHRRICERLPDSGLSRVAAELLHIAAESRVRIARARQPLWGLRILGLAAIASLGGMAIAAGVLSLRVSPHVGSLADVIQATNAALNDIILMAIAVFFLLNLEGRVKRHDALRALHELRSIAHVVDMHQLTKDPEQFLSPPSMATASSPPRTMTRFQLARYLDYCSELLSLTSKLAALHAQSLNDPVVLSAVNDVESLAGALSATIWQKTMILDAVTLRERQTEPR